MKKVAVIMGSDSDLPVVEKAINTLEEYGVPFEVHVYSAHRTPVEAKEFSASARENGFGAIIAAAGMAAHLAGAVAANTTLPVIGIPVAAKYLDGMDALLSTVMMPTGMPVATVAVNGAANAALLAIQILAIEDKELEAKLADVIHEKEEAIGNQHFERAAKLRDEERRLRKEFSELKDKLGAERTDTRSEEITDADVAATLTRLTGIPVKDMTEDESRRLGELNSKLSERVIGQKQACDAVCSTILRGRTGLGRKNGPIGSFIFLGRSGVGKTELCRALSELLFGSQKFLIRFDMSEYMEKHSVSRLIGAPPGYVGYDEGGNEVGYVFRERGFLAR